jgi:lipopolysaccharide transport system ATP-binding protein
MSSEPVVSVRDVGKTYYLYASPQDALIRPVQAHLASRGWVPRPLRHWLRARADRHGRRFDALAGVTFEAARGEALGIIGRNGSGKSTLLQIVAGTLTPTSGTVAVDGRVAALLELGSGFNPDFTGRENLVLSGMILGAGPDEMKERLPEIVAFAEIGEFLDQPVKTYSSGMMLRLAFAVQISLAPDVLIVDEALSVGDIFFAQKCVRRIKELQARGTTILFVSHDMALVRDLCQRAVYLREGRLEFVGAKDRAISLYFRSASMENAARLPTSERAPGERLSEGETAGACWTSAPDRAAEADARLLAVWVVDGEQRPTLTAALGDRITIRVCYESRTTEPVHVAVVLKNRYDQVIFSGGSYTQRVPPPVLAAGERGWFEMELTCMIEAGRYTFLVALAVAAEANRGMRIDETPWLGPLTVTWDYDALPAPFHGLFGLPSDARFPPRGPREDAANGSGDGRSGR